MALKVGDLYVSLTANTQKLEKELNNAARKVEAFGRNLKNLGKDASDMSNMVTAAVAAAVAVASSKDAAVKKQVDELKNQSTALAIEVARVALPVLQQMADFVGRLVALFRSLTPEQKAMVTTFIEAAGAVTAVGMAAVKIEPAFKLIATGIRLVATGMGALGVGLLPALAGVAAFIGLAGLLREAWDENLGGVQETSSKVWTWMQTNGPKVGSALADVAGFVGRAFQKLFIWMYEAWAKTATQLVEGVAWVAKKLRLDNYIDVDGVKEFALTTIEWIKQLPTDSGLAALKQDAIDQFGKMKSGVSKIADDISKKVKGIFDGLPKAAKATAFKDIEKAQTDYGRLRADRLSTSFTALDTGANLKQAVEMAGGKNVPERLAEFTAKTFESAQGVEDLRDVLHKLGASAGEAAKWVEEKIKKDEKAAELAKHVDRLREDRVPQATQQFFAGGTFGDAAKLSGVTTTLPDFLEKLNGSSLTSLSAFEDIEDQLAQVRDLSPVARELWDRVKKNYLEGIEEEKQKAELKKQQYEQAISGFKDSVVGSLGKLGGVIQAATGPMAQAGGPIGALVAVGFELLKNSKQFGEFQAALDGVIQGLSDALGQLLPPFTMLVNAIQPIVAAVGAIVAQVVPLLTSVIEPLLPVFVVLGALLMALSPIVGVLVKILEISLIPIMGVLNGVMQALFSAIKVVAYVILGYVVLYSELWNGILSAVQTVLTFLASIEIAGGKPFAFLAEWATSLESSKAATDTYKQQMADVSNMTWDAAMTTAQSFGNAAGAADQLASGMTNAASGFKVDLARFNATNVGSTPGSPADLGVGSGALTGDTYVTIVSNDPEVIWERLEGVRRRKAFNLGRGPLGNLPAFGS